MERKMARNNLSINNWEQVRYHYICCKRSTLTLSTYSPTFWYPSQHNNSLFWQPIRHHPYKRTPVPCMHKTHQHSIPFYTLDHWRWKTTTHLLSYRRNGSRHIHQSPHFNKGQTFRTWTWSRYILRRSVGGTNSMEFLGRFQGCKMQRVWRFFCSLSCVLLGSSWTYWSVASFHNVLIRSIATTNAIHSCYIPVWVPNVYL